MTRLVILTCIGFTTLLADSSRAADGDPGRPVLEGLTFQEFTLGSDRSPLLEFLKDVRAAIPQRVAAVNGVMPMAQPVRFTVKEDTLLVIGCAWSEELTPFLTETTMGGVQSRRKLIDLGWEPFGRFSHRTSIGPAQYTLFLRQAKAGEKITVWPDILGDVVVFEPGDWTAEVAALPAWRPGLHQIPPVHPATLAGGFPQSGVVLLTQNAARCDDHGRTGIFDRELFRQALLIAARDELQQPTRDQSLRELAGGVGNTPAELAPLTLICSIEEPQTVRLTVARWKQSPADSTDSGNSWDVLRELTLPLNPAGDLQGKVSLAGSLSRGEFREVLSTSGFSGQGNDWSDDAPVDPAISTLLESLHFVPVFDGIRRLHAEIKATGESPARLVALAQGYAVLGSLAEPFWLPARKAFQARALLYAERLQQRVPDHPDAVQIRAWCWALFGHHALALKDLAAADQMDQKPSLGFRTNWSPVIDSFCRFDRAALEQAAEQGDQTALAGYLLMLLDDGNPLEQARRQAALKRLRVERDCVRALELLASVESLGSNRIAVELSTVTLPPLLYNRLQKVAGLPESIRKQLRDAPAPQDDWPGEIKARAGIIRSLKDASREDDQEPSWSVLGQLVSDMSLLQAWRLVQLERKILAVDTSASEAVLQPLIDTHPLGDILRIYGQSSRDGWARYAQNLDISLVDSSHPFFLWTVSQMMPLRRTMGERLRPANLRCMSEPSHQDLIRRNNIDGIRMRFSDQLLTAVSPHSTHLAVSRIEAARDQLPTDAAELETKYAREPMVLRALANSYSRHGKVDDALRCLKLVAQFVPEYSTYMQMARIHEDRGDMELWQQTLDEFLKQPETGLEHSRVRVNIAQHLMDLGKYEDALPYAERAAESHAQWALACAAQCQESLGRWAKADSLWETTAERYPRSASSWYFFGARTGQGNRAAQEAAMRAWIRSSQNRASVETVKAVVYFQMINGPVSDAAANIQIVVPREPTKYIYLLAALLADADGKTAERDQFLQQARAARFTSKNRRDGAAEFNRLISVIQSDLRAGGKGALAISLVDDAIISLKGSDLHPIWLGFFTAWYLDHHGQDKLAQKYFSFVAESASLDDPLVAVASDRLHKQSIPIGPRRLRSEDADIKRYTEADAADKK